MLKPAIAVVLIASAFTLLGGASAGASQPGPIADATGCQRVPASGYLQPGAPAATTLEYSNLWQWSNASASESFDWSIRKGDGTVVASGSSGGSGGSHSLAANNYLFRIVNRGAVGQFWNVCYDVV
jgi:hypothetical protein